MLPSQTKFLPMSEKGAIGGSPRWLCETLPRDDKWLYGAAAAMLQQWGDKHEDKAHSGDGGTETERAQSLRWDAVELLKRPRIEMTSLHASFE